MKKQQILEILKAIPDDADVKFSHAGCGGTYTGDITGYTVTTNVKIGARDPEKTATITFDRYIARND